MFALWQKRKVAAENGRVFELPFITQLSNAETLKEAKEEFAEEIWQSADPQVFLEDLGLATNVWDLSPEKVNKLAEKISDDDLIFWAHAEIEKITEKELKEYRRQQSVLLKRVK